MQCVYTCNAIPVKKDRKGRLFRFSYLYPYPSPSLRVHRFKSVGEKPPFIRLLLVIRVRLESFKKETEKKKKPCVISVTPFLPV